jgi:16S rRNA (guanine527-N7)-methyltransferase
MISAKHLAKLHAKPPAKSLVAPVKPRPIPSARRAQQGWGPRHQDALRKAMEAMALPATSAQRDALGAYAGLLLKWNRVYNLLGTADPDTVLRSHLVDTLAVLPALARWLPTDNAPLVDVGSGGGLPGIPIAIMRPSLPVVLVEPTGKKAAFLRQVVAECRLRQVSVQEARLEALSPSDLHDVSRHLSIANTHFICRAFTSLAEFARLCGPRSGHDSLIMAMKAVRVEDEIMELRASMPKMDVLAVEPLSIPGQDIERNLVVMQFAQPAATGPATTRSGD